MRTTDRYGNTISAAELDAQNAARSWVWDWDVRLIDMAGDPTTSAGWTTYVIPQAAIRRIHRTGALDGLMWELEIEIEAEFLPASVTVQQFYRLEVDRAYASGRWPYFTGVVDTAVTQWALKEGAACQIVVVKALDMLRLTKDLWIRYFAVEPVTLPAAATATTPLTGITQQQTYFSFTGAGAGNTNTNCIVASTFGADSALAPTALVLAWDSAFANLFTLTTDYTVSIDASGRLNVAWTNSANATAHAGGTIYAKAHVVQFFGSSRVQTNKSVGSTYGFTPAAFFKCPAGRDPRDLYHTTVSALNSGAKTITPNDPTAYKSGASLLDTAQGEYLYLIDANGVEEVVQITSTDANGVITCTAWFANATPAVGSAIHLCTTEMYPGWDELGQLTTGGSSTHGNILFTAASNGTSPYQRRVFWSKANLGIAVPAGWHFKATDAVYLKGNYITTDTGNRVENFLFTTMLGASPGFSLFAASDILTNFTGAFIKSGAGHGLTVLDLIREYKDHFLPPNAYAHGELDGKVSLKAYTQKASPSFDWQMPNIAGIRQIAAPDPPTAAVVLSKDAKPLNVANKYFVSATGGATAGTNPSADSIGTEVVDGLTTVEYVQRVTTTPIVVKFRIPGESPQELYPQIQDVAVFGRGFLSAYVQPISGTYAADNFYIQVSTFEANDTGSEYQVRIGAASGGTLGVGSQVGTPAVASRTISGEAIAKARALGALNGNTTSDYYLFIQIDADDSSGAVVAGSCSEIQVNIAELNGWRAQMSDDNSGSPPTGWKPTDATQTGTIWWQSDTAQRESRRYVPSSWLKRTATKYDQSWPKCRHRTRIHQLLGASQQDCRNRAEAYMDEYYRTSSGYEVTAPLYDPAELGDTVVVPMVDGTFQFLFLWAVEHEWTPNGGAAANMAKHKFLNYAS